MLAFVYVGKIFIEKQKLHIFQKKEKSFPKIDSEIKLNTDI